MESIDDAVQQQRTKCRISYITFHIFICTLKLTLKFPANIRFCGRHIPELSSGGFSYSQTKQRHRALCLWRKSLRFTWRGEHCSLGANAFGIQLKWMSANECALLCALQLKMSSCKTVESYIYIYIMEQITLRRSNYKIFTEHWALSIEH